MQIFILVTAILELAAGAMLLLAADKTPDFKEAPSSTLTWGKMYGAGAVGIGTFALLTWLGMDAEAVRIFLQTFMVFHLLVGMVAFMGYRKGDFSNPGVAILHGVFALLTLFFYLS